MMGEQKDIPESWVNAALGDIADVGAGNPAPQGAQYFSENGPLFVRVQDMGKLNGNKYIQSTKDKLSADGSQSLRIFLKGTILFTKSGASTLLNQRAILAQDSYIVSHIGTAFPARGISSKWLYYFLTTIDFAKYAHGANMPSMPISKAKEISFPIPPPSEQRRIVAKIEELFSELDKGVENLKNARAQLKTYRQAVLKHAFEGKLTARWRKQNAATPWVKTTLGDQISFLTSGSRGWAKFYANKGEIFIRAQNLKYDRLDLDEVAFVQLPDKSEGKRTLLQTGDLLITITGANVTKTAFVKADFGTAYVSQHVALARPVDDSNTEFLHWFLIAESFGRKQLNKSAYGAGKPGLNLDNIRSVEINLPSPSEQAEIVSQISAILSIEESVISHIEEQIKKTEALRHSILKKAFSGQLVPQDINDEPASVLLERIRAEKEVQRTAKTKPKKNTKRKTAA